MRRVALVFFTCFTGLSFGQIVYEFDTLTYVDRMNGTIDSIDVSGSDAATTFDGGISIISPKGLSSTTLSRNYTKPNFLHFIDWRRMQFSALPHLGFSYSFGGQGSQYLKTKYSQAFTKNTVLNIEYLRNSGLGSIRNSGFTNNDVSLQFQQKGRRYAMQLKGGFKSHDVAHSGGLYSDSLIEDFGLEFSPVYKSDAHSVNKSGQALLKNYFNFLPDSTKMLGLTTVHHYWIKNRVYTELDTLYGIYSNVYIDSFETRDQHNLAKILNGAGVFFASPKFYIDGIVDYSYWDFQNLGLHSDTTEIGIQSSVNFRIKGISIENNLNFNVIGAYNEWSERARLAYKKDKFKLGAFLSMENSAPTPIQRKYFANNSNYVMSGLSNQNTLKVGGEVAYSFWDQRILLAGFADLHSVSNLIKFNGDEWVNDSLVRSFSTLGIKSSLHFGVLNFHPKFIYSLDTQGFLPDIQLYGRLFVKGKLFKSKKLEVLIGVDFSYISSYTTKAYIPRMDAYDWDNSGSTFDPMVNLHAFLTLGIDEFRFFFRYENIGYYWSDKTNQVLNNYPIAGTRLRIGLTWDFFN